MNTQTLLHYKKVRNMGRILTAITWFSILICVFAMLLMGFFINFLGNVRKLPEESKHSIVDMAFYESTKESLPDGITVDMTVGELIKADNTFLNDHMTLCGIHFICAMIFYIIIAVILLRIAGAWRQGDPFQQKAIRGFRWLGVLMLGQVFVGMAYEALAPESLSAVMQSSEIYDIALGLFSGSGCGGPSLISAIIFLTLSWVLEHGRMLKDEQDLTV